MVICFNARPEAKKALDGLMATGQFADTSEAIAMALVNYEVIQKAVSQTGELGSDVLAQGGANSAPTEDHRALAKTSLERGPSESAASPRIPDIFTLKTIVVEGLNILPSPEPPERCKASLPPAAWLFGQYNKFLPSKATCRALLNLLQQSPGGIAPNDATSKISFAACGLGDYLLALDSRLRLRREESYSAAFPSSAISDGDSRLRFGTQFVANMRQGQLTGLPAALRFIAAEDGKGARISLTKPGAEFASLPNPVLDEDNPTPVRKFSEAETEFLLAHITQSVPEEISAYTAILDAVETGANTPDRVDAYLRKRFKLPAEKDITKTFLTTQRTGAISRMVDLGLLAREKEGLRVTYVLTEQGKKLRNLIDR